jgi:FliI/YscN family ATPase
VKLDELREKLAERSPARIEGRLKSVTGLSVTAELPSGRVGDIVVIRRRGAPLLAEIVGLRDGEVVALPLGDAAGVGPNDPVESTGGPLEVRLSESLLGRVLDGLGQPVDGKGVLAGPLHPVDEPPPAALSRKRVDTRLATGVRAIDGFCTLGVGQRIGLFSGSGVGKSTLLASLALGASADVVVVGLVGERGREVREFLDRVEGPLANKSVFVVATSDAPAVERIRAAQVATRVAEFFRDRGQRVLLLLDSVTRVARAQREVGLAAGEPPTRRGYPPSVFSMLPRLLERSGQGDAGSITAVYAVLVEGDDLDEPVTDEVRGILDGHIVLARRLAAQHHYPAIDVTASVSRVMQRVTSSPHLRAAATARSLLAAYEEKRDLIVLGAYRDGTDATVDRAVRARADLDRFLRQGADEVASFDATVTALELPNRIRPRLWSLSRRHPCVHDRSSGPSLSHPRCRSFRRSRTPRSAKKATSRSPPID